MSFSADWLALRQVADDRARSADLTRTLALELAKRPGPLRILDLGAGTGANMRALAPQLAGPQHWVLADNDPALLGKVSSPAGPTGTPLPSVEVEQRIVDLASDLSSLFDPAPDLVTASAFFDLCGRAIADEVVSRTAAAGAVFHTVLTYDGHETWTPGHQHDADVLSAFHEDQQRDKGLGPALGPDATAHLSNAFQAAGYAVRTASSDWDLQAPGDAGMIVAMAEGHAAVARSAIGAAADDWQAAQSRTQRWVVGHQDLLALPPAR
ncbi:MAG: SAM-dependent methyltransferase [Pseudomonadota bacterium]